MRHLASLLVLCALAGAGELAPVTLPVASKGIADKGEENRLVVSVDKSGFVCWRGKKPTLEELGVVVRNMKDAYELKMKRKGKAGTEKRGGADVSRLSVLLRVDRTVPWQHVQWLMTIMAEQRIYKLQFAVKPKDGPDPKPPALEGRLDAHLPTDKGILARGKEPPQEIKVAVHIVARKEVQGKWGPDGLPVMKPTAFLYRFGDRQTESLEAVTEWIRDAKKAASAAKGVKVVGEIKAGHKVPFQQIVTLLNEFRAEGLEHVDFYGTAIPGKELRKLPYLPYPKTNYPTR